LDDSGVKAGDLVVSPYLAREGRPVLCYGRNILLAAGRALVATHHVVWWGRRAGDVSEKQGVVMNN